MSRFFLRFSVCQVSSLWVIVHCSYALLVESDMSLVDLFLGLGKILGACPRSLVADLGVIPELTLDFFCPTACLGKRGLCECYIAIT